jgi:hypothetical protein
VCLVGLAVLAAACAGPSRGPISVVDRYIRAIERNRPDEAYALLSERARARLSRAAFARQLELHRAEALGQARELRRARHQATRLAMSADVPLGSGRETELTVERRRWRLEQGLQQGHSGSTPVMALRAFVQALERRDLDQVMRLLSSRVRQNLERELRQRVDRLKTSIDKDSIDVRGNRAELRYDRNYRIQLVRENGEWHIVNFD